MAFLLVTFSWLFRGFFVALFCLEKQCLGLFRGFFVVFSWLFRGFFVAPVLGKIYAYSPWNSLLSIRETKMDQNGPFWPKEVYFGPFRSTNRTLTTPENMLKERLTRRFFFSLSSFFWPCIAISAATYRGAKCPTLKTAEKGAEWVAVKQPKNSRKNSRNTRKTAVLTLFRLVFRLFFRLLYRDPLGTFSAVFRLFSMSGIWHLCRWPQSLQAL